MKKFFTTKLVLLYILIGIVIAVPLCFFFNQLSVNNYNEYYRKYAEEYENRVYYQADLFTEKELEPFKSYEKRRTMAEKFDDYLNNRNHYFASLRFGRLSTSESEFDVVSYDDKYIYSIASDGHLKVYDIEDGNTIAELDTGGNSLLVYNGLIISLGKNLAIYKMNGKKIELCKDFGFEFWQAVGTVKDGYLYLFAQTNDYSGSVLYDHLSNINTCYKIYKIDLNTLNYYKISIASNNGTSILFKDDYIVMVNPYIMECGSKEESTIHVLDSDLNSKGIIVCDGRCQSAYDMEVDGDTLRIITSFGDYSSDNSYYEYDLKNMVQTKSMTEDFIQGAISHITFREDSILIDQFRDSYILDKNDLTKCEIASEISNATVGHEFTIKGERHFIPQKELYVYNSDKEKEICIYDISDGRINFRVDTCYVHNDVLYVVLVAFDAFKVVMIDYNRETLEVEECRGGFGYSLNSFVIGDKLYLVTGNNVYIVTMIQA